MSLPRNVVREDHRLEKEAEKTSSALAELRWHWTLDETNPKRVSFTEYGKEVGLSNRTIQANAQAFLVYTSNPGISMSDARTRARLSTDRLTATEAVANARGVTLETAEHKRRNETRRVLDIARNRAEEKGTTVEEEAPKVADWMLKSEQSSAETRESRAQSPLRYIELEGHVDKARRALLAALDTARDAELDEEARELLESSLGQLRALLNLIDLAIVGNTDIDWDAELGSLVGD